MNIIDETTMERLVFVKSLHREAVQQTNRPMPMASISVLMFHDAVELFLYIAAEELDTKANSNILDSWNNIEQKSGKDLYGHSGIKRMKEARVGLKHFANRPDKRDIESFRAVVESFFDENTPKIFGIDYSDIKLAQLVEFDEAREFLLEAENLAHQHDYEKAMGYLKYAYRQLMSEYRDRSKWDLEYTPFPTFKLGRTRDNDDLERIQEVFNEVEDALMFISLGIDYSRYSRFNHLTPRLVMNQNSDNEFAKYRPHVESYSYAEQPEGAYEYCTDFLIGLALSLQNLDFNFEIEPTPSTKSALDW
jgi:hypothetical protein